MPMHVRCSAPREIRGVKVTSSVDGTNAFESCWPDAAVSAINWLKHKALATSAETGTPTLPPLDRTRGAAAARGPWEPPPQRSARSGPQRNEGAPATFTEIAEHGPTRLSHGMTAGARSTAGELIP